MALVSRWMPLGEVSSRAFDAEVRGLAQRVAVEDLGERLYRSGPIPIRRTSYTHLVDRVRLECADGSALKLRLYGPRRPQVDTLNSIRFDDRVGWIVGTEACGSSTFLYAWLATYQR